MHPASPPPQVPALGEDDIHLWMAFFRAPPHDARLDAYARWLSEFETRQEARFRFEPDRIRYRVTRAMLRRVLAGYLGLAPSDCVFETNEFGRPAAVNAEARRERLEFNLSHTEDLILLGVTRGRALGVDVERVSGTRASADLATRYFSEDESRAVRQAPPESRDDLFFQYWTLKESYVKARGRGLALPLNQFGFTLQPGGAQLWTRPGLDEAAGRWSFLRLRPTPAHHAAVCVEGGPGGPPRLQLLDFATLALADPAAAA